MGRQALLALAGLVFLAQAALANPIPVPLPASMPLEEMRIDIQHTGGAFHATFAGDFTFDYIPPEVTGMWFPVPAGAANLRVRQDREDLVWTWSDQRYPTVLPEEPSLPMVQWSGPFPKAGAVFTVDYEHDLIERPGELIFFYALGTGKYFPTYQKITTAKFDISLPPAITPSRVLLDHMPVDPSHYEIVGSDLRLTLTSQFGPFTNDLIVSFVPEPSAFLLLSMGVVAVLAYAGRQRRCR